MGPAPLPFRLNSRLARKFPFRISALLIVLALALTGCVGPKPIAKKGVLDLSGWDWTTTAKVELRGEWSYWWNQLVEPSELDRTAAPTFFSMPGYWNSLKENQAPPKGSATYRLRVLIPSPPVPLAIGLEEVASAYKLYVDGKLVAEMGKTSQSNWSYRAQSDPKLYAIDAQNGELEIVLQVSNFVERFGGFHYSPVLGLHETLERQEHSEIIVQSFLFVGLLFLSLLFFALYLLKPAHSENLWLSLFGIAIAIRTLATGPRLIASFLTDIPYEALIKGEYFTIFFAVIFISLYFRQLFSVLWPSKLFIPFLFYTVLYVILGFFLPLDVYTSAFLFYEIPLILVLVLCFWISVKAFLKRAPGSLMLLIGMFVMLLGVVNDLMVYNNWLATGYTVEKILFLFLIANCIVVSQNLAKDYRVNEERSKELKELDKLKDDFLARVTHELKTPLHGMIGIIEAFRNGELESLTERQHYHMRLLSSSSTRLLSMVNNILDFSQLKKRQLPLEPRPVFLKETVDFLLPSLSSTAKPAVTIVNRLSPQLPPALGDEIRLQQVFHHLLSNAIRHTESGIISVEADQRDQNLEIQVRDTGEGIPADRQSRLFGPFSQAMDLDTRRISGVGLGLAICKEFIEQMGGRIRLVSDPGKGTNVIFTLPICPPVKLQYYRSLRMDQGLKVKAEEPIPIAIPAPSDPGVEPAPGSPTRGSVLIVDDEPVNLLVLKSFLKKLEFEVFEAFDGPSGLQVLANNNVDLMILDVMMPGMSGFEVCTKARERFTPARLPIILLTAKNSLEDLLKGFESGASDFLTKPFNRDEMKARIDFHLKLSTTARSGSYIPNSD